MILQLKFKVIMKVIVVVLALMALCLSLLAETGLMVYLWWAACHNHFGVEIGDKAMVVSFIINYIWCSIALVLMVLQSVRWASLGHRNAKGYLSLWCAFMLLFGDEFTRVAVDLFMALVTHQDWASFKYRDNVWIW